ncbi:MAG TPA: PQQ-dependent sugar dehydrogenase [Polyangiaceae bacterium]|nr:PQQ-dependent sugar dehydrogenase [Polyangiaceae bacterium]
MSTRSRTALPILPALVPALLLASVFSACGGDDGDGGPDSDGVGGADAADAAGSGNGGEAPGTGGNEGTPPARVPGTDGYDCTAASGSIPALQLAPIVPGFTRPVLVTHAPNDEERLFVVEQDGLIWVVTRSGSGDEATYTKSTEPFLDVDALTRSPGDQVGDHNERGLLGLAFHPDYAENGLFYIHHIANGDEAGTAEGDVLIEEFQVSSDPNVADPASKRLVLQVPHPHINHNGGALNFGSDGYLYIAIGDGGNDFANFQIDPDGYGQRTDDLLGNLLRISPTADGSEPYTVPSGNLVDDEPSAADEIWDFGLRNPFRFNFDGCTGRLYVGDVGQGSLEEIDVEEASEGGKNYGWSLMEGTECREAGCDETGLIQPVATFSTGGSSIVGGAVYRGTQIPALRGTYFYGETSGANRIFTFVYESGKPTTPVERTDDVNPSTDEGRYILTSLQNGGDGEIYATDMATGALLQLQAE